jgi:arginine decarboxylase
MLESRGEVLPTFLFDSLRGTMIPKRAFFVNGVGIHKERLASFESALRDAGIEKFNLVYVSSIFPPNCKIVSRKEGLKYLRPGQIVFCVMSRNDTCEPNRLIASAVGLAVPHKKEEQYGYISEHHAYGQKSSIAGDYAEDLAATMLATTLGIEFDPDLAWDERKQIYKASGHIFKTRNICQSAEGHKHGRWTTVLTAVVFVME